MRHVNNPARRTPSGAGDRPGRLLAPLRGAFEAVARLTGRARLAVAFAAGALGALAMAPFGLWPVLAVSFPLLVLLLDGARGEPVRPLGARLKTAATVGWWFGFGYFLASLWWIGAAFLVEADVFGWLLPFAVVAMPAGLALFMALGAAVAMLLWSPGPARLAAFAFAFTVSEWLRGHVLTGFPWNTFGYAFAESLTLMQSVVLVGTYGLTFFALLLLSTPVLLRRPGWRGGAIVLFAGSVLAGAALFGAVRLQGTPQPMVPGVHLRIMQPNLPQDQKFSYPRRNQILTDYLALSARPSALYPRGLQDVSVLVWPESAFPFIYEREPWAAEAIAGTLPDHVTLVTGAVRYGTPPHGQSSPFFNSIRVIDGEGRVLSSTDKVHLVPFGEYLPFQHALESLGLEQLTRVRGGFSAGANRQPLIIPGLPVAAPLVCYEVIFPGEVLPAGARPGLLLNLTNDAWFGLTPGPYQHFVQARLRAVEEGLPLVRAANTGISAIIDPLGRIVAASELGQEALVDGPLPVAMKTVPVLAQIPNTVLALLLAIALGAAIVPFWNVFARKSLSTLVDCVPMFAGSQGALRYAKFRVLFRHSRRDHGQEGAESHR